MGGNGAGPEPVESTEATEATGATEANETNESISAPINAPDGTVKTEVQKGQKGGELYEVVYDSVWIRREPDAKASRVSKRIKGQRLQILEFDESGFWGRTAFKTSEGMDEGWMLLAHGEFGELLRPVQDDGQGFVVRPQ